MDFLHLHHLLVYVFKSWEGNSLCWIQSRVVDTLVFVVFPPSLWKTRLSSSSPLKHLQFCDCAKGLRWAPGFVLGILLLAQWQGKCSFNCAVTFRSLLGSPSALYRHCCMVFLCPALNCSAYLFRLLGDMLIMNIWNMAVRSRYALCNARFCWNFPGTPPDCSGALLVGMFCLLGRRS